MSFKIAVVGATGAVGREMLQTLEERSFPIKEIVALASEKSIIANARCLTEGVDIPAIDAVVFADPKQSVIDMFRLLGEPCVYFQTKILVIS